MSILKTYRRFVQENWKGGGNLFKELFLMTSGLMGETGAVIDAMGKEMRDGVDKRDEIGLELGDVLYYLVKIADYYDFTIEELIEMNMKKLNERNGK